MKKYFSALSAVFSIALIFAVVSCASTSQSKPSALDEYLTKPITEINALDLVANIKVGWNLGNTLDASHSSWKDSDADVEFYERAWNKTPTTQELIDIVKNAGFNAIRIPVSWWKCVDSEYNIRADWMERVKEIVGYAVNNNMVIILNTHHDEEIFKLTNAGIEETKKAFSKVWAQIAEAFKDHGSYLIFECLNEPRTPNSPMEWRGGTIDERSNLNDLIQLFVDTVRASGGNNAYRVLMIPTYAATSTNAAAISALKIPNDTVENRIIVSLHAYEPYDFALNDKSKVNTWSQDKGPDRSAITVPLDRAYDTFVSKGIPVIIGEFGALDKNNESIRAQWGEFFVKYAKSKDIRCFWWDDGASFALMDRPENEVYFTEIVAGLMRGAK